jgi:hypothetical protein
VSESESSVELVEELVLESVKEDEAGKSPRWHKQVALSSLVLALLAALAGLLAGLTASQELHVRTQEIMELTRLENERVSVQVLRTKHELLEGLGRAADPAELAQIQAFEEEMQALGAELAAEEEQDQRTGYTHLILAIAVMLLSVGITLGGMAIVVEEKFLWCAGLVVGAAGILGLVLGVVRMLA